MLCTLRWNEQVLVYKGFKKGKLILEIEKLSFVDTDVVEVNYG